MCERSESLRKSLCLAWAYAGIAKGGATFLGSGQVACRGSGAWRNHALAREVLGHAPHPEKYF